MTPIQMNDLVASMRDLQVAAGGGMVPIGPASEAAPASSDFADLLAGAIDQVNASQRGAERLAEAFERGERNVDLVQVVVAMQKADLSFQTMAEVRNNLVRAYRDVMNMPV